MPSGAEVRRRWIEGQAAYLEAKRELAAAEAVAAEAIDPAAYASKADEFWEQLDLDEKSRKSRIDRAKEELESVKNELTRSFDQKCQRRLDREAAAKAKKNNAGPF